MKALEYEEALSCLLAHIKEAAAVERVPLGEVLHRVAAQDMRTGMEQPPFDRSPLDGFAFQSGDSLAATAEAPAVLAIGETVLAGDGGAYVLKPGQALRVMTGARIPAGADCVARQEDVSVQGGTVAVPRAYGAYENYCFRGEDAAPGACMVKAEERILPAHVAMLAAQGISTVPVFRRPAAGVFATGDELAEVGASLGGARIYDSNSYAVAAALLAMGAEVHRLPPQPDDPERLAGAVESLWETCGVVVTTGGVSVGQADYMPAVAQALGGRLLFHRVNLKPGAPLLAMEKDGKLLLALSGNPFAAMATFALFGLPVARKMAGLRPYAVPAQTAVLVEDYEGKGGVRRFVRAALRDGRVRVPGGNHSPGAFFSAAACNCLLDVPASATRLRAGEGVRVIPWEAL